MSKRFNHNPQHYSQHVMADLPPFYRKAYVVAAILGLIVGLGWTAWHLIKLHVLG